MAAAAPTLDVDLYGDAAVRDSRTVFARVRETAPVVWLPRHDMFAMGRFADVRAALRNDEVFRSGHGIAANPMGNQLGRETTLVSDGETHVRRRKVLMRSLGHKALAAVGDRVDEHAEKLIERLAHQDRFEASADFASHLPLNVVADLVGLPEDGDRLLSWAGATFDSLGPMNPRGTASAEVAVNLLHYTQQLDADRVAPGSWAASVFEARDAGELSTAEAQSLVVDFVAPALDTTILASTHLLWVLARNPEAWDEIRADPDLIPRAVVENVRIASPIRGFTREVAADHEVEGVTLPAGSRVVLLFGAANLDERQFQDPERDRKSVV